MPREQFTLDDFRRQMLRYARPSIWTRLTMWLSCPQECRKLLFDDDSRSRARRTIGVIDSMTFGERRCPSLIDKGRCRRIADGAGVTVWEVRQLVHMLNQMFS